MEKDKAGTGPCCTPTVIPGAAPPRPKLGRGRRICCEFQSLGPAPFFVVCHFMVKLHVQRLLESPDGWYAHSFLSNPFSLSNTSIFGCYAFVWWLLYLKQPWFSAKEHPSVDDFFIEHGIFPLNPLVAPGVNPFAFCWTPNFFCFYPWTLANLLYGCLTSHFHLAAEIESFGCVNLQVLLSQWYYIKHNIFLLNNSSSSWLYPHVYFLLNFSRLKSGRCLGCARESRLGCLWNHHLSCLNPLTFHILKLNLWHFRISTLFKGSIPCFLFSL